MAVSTILSPGAKVGGKYEVVEVLGFGGMGVVYKVREQVGAVSRIRALKTVLPQFASDASVVARFREEAEKMCMLEHENIVPVLSYSEEGEFPYLVMPFIEGQTLKDYLASAATETRRGLPLSDVMEIGLEVVRGLEVAHRFVNPETQRPQPMVHRDIKPGNVMVRVDNASGERRLKVLIMDFGIAKVLSDQDAGHSLTEVIGTVKYASPEQIRRGKDIDPRADIYSLGMVLYELYAGRHMFTGLSEHSVLMRMVQRDVQDFEIEFPPDAPERFRQLITRCVAVDREKRFANVAEIRTLMRRIQEEDSERLVSEAAQAREFVGAQRSAAVERGAQQFAATTFAEADAALAQGEAALAERRLKAAIQSLRAAAERFARAAEEADEGRERERLAQGLAGLAELRSAALAADAERLAPQELTAAAAATEALERALHDGDLTGASRALAQAERIWREARERATQERGRRDAVAACERLEAAIAATRAELSRLPERYRGASEIADIRIAEAKASAARVSSGADDHAGAAALAGEGLALLDEITARRSRALARGVVQQSRQLEERLSAVESSPDVTLAATRHGETRRIADAARRLATDHPASPDSLAALESALDAVVALERDVAAQAAERERRLQAAERNRNAEPGARAALEDLRRARAALAGAGAPREAESAAVNAVSAAAAQAEGQLAKGEYADALPLLRAASVRLSEIAAAIARRIERERVEARLAELQSQARQRRQALGALGAAVETAEARRLDAALGSAQTHAARGESLAAIRILETLLPDLDRATAAAHAELERARERAAAEVAGQRAQNASSRAESLGARARQHTAFAPALADLERGREAVDAERFPQAVAHFSQATERFEGVIAEVEAAERAQRLEALASRRAAIATNVEHLPPARPFRRRRRAINKSLAAADAALARADEAEAERRLAELESSVGTLLNDAATQLVAEPSARLPWMTWAVGGGAAVAGAALLLVTRAWPPPPTRVATTSAPPVIAEPTAEPIAPTALPEARVTAEPRIAPSPAAVVQPTAAIVAEAPTSEATAPPLVEPTVPVHAPPLVLASAQPASRTVKLHLGDEPRFDASLRNGDDDSLAWRLGGQTVGRGRSVVLRKDATATPGRKRLEVVAERDGSLVSLRGWDLDIQPPTLGFAGLEPSGRSIERSPGGRVSFRAPVNLADDARLAFLWQVNGEPARGADGPAYDFQPQAPGEYVVQVRATAPWGASVANSWTVLVRAPVPTPELRQEIAKTDPRADAEAWIQAYCTAFEHKDTDALLALGHLTSQAEAARLRDALSSMNELKVSCTNPSVRVSGDQAVVSFDRTDHWTDPRGTVMERALPRISKTLRRDKGRWVVVQ